MCPTLTRSGKECERDLNFRRRKSYPCVEKVCRHSISWLERFWWSDSGRAIRVASSLLSRKLEKICRSCIGPWVCVACKIPLTSPCSRHSLNAQSLCLEASFIVSPIWPNSVDNSVRLSCDCISEMGIGWIVVGTRLPRRCSRVMETHLFNCRFSRNQSHGARLHQ